MTSSWPALSRPSTSCLTMNEVDALSLVLRLGAIYVAFFVVGVGSRREAELRRMRPDCRNKRLGMILGHCDAHPFPARALSRRAHCPVHRIARRILVPEYVVQKVRRPLFLIHDGAAKELVLLGPDCLHSFVVHGVE